MDDDKDLTGAATTPPADDDDDAGVSPVAANANSNEPGTSVPGAEETGEDAVPGMMPTKDEDEVKDSEEEKPEDEDEKPADPTAAL